MEPRIQPDLTPYPLDPAGADLAGEAAALRERGPAALVELPGGVTAWAITSASLLKELLTDPRVSKDAHQHWPRLASGEVGPEWPLFIWVAVQNMFTAYGKDHTRLRRLIAPAFTAHRTKAMAPRVEGIVNQLIDTLAATPAGEAADLRAAFADPLPMQVICELMGLSEEQRPALRACVDVAFASTSTAEAMMDAIGQMYGILAELVALKRASPGEDLTSDLIAQRDEDGSGLAEQELLDTLILVISAGFDTTVNLLDQAIFTLLSQPEQLAHVTEGRAGWEDVIEETLRTEAPGAYLPLRYAVSDIDLTATAGVTIRQGDAILAAYGAAGTDPAVHGETAGEFDALRERHDHLAFGYGTHLCLGAPLARLEANTGLPALFKKFPNMRLACPPEELEHIPSFLSNGHTSLPVVLKP